MTDFNPSRRSQAGESQRTTLLSIAVLLIVIASGTYLTHTLVTPQLTRTPDVAQASTQKPAPVKPPPVVVPTPLNPYPVTVTVDPRVNIVTVDPRINVGRGR